MVIVGGIFASLTLPAYASSIDPEVQRVVAAQTSLQAYTVGGEVTAATLGREAFGATSAAQLRATTAVDLRGTYRSTISEANMAAYLASGARDLGDDYPWPGSLTRAQGGGLSPLRYYYRECVDFVAWRLNRDVGSTGAPFVYDWSTLTPGGGNASAWKSAWQSKGWPTSNTPVVGAVAWFTYNHVAYVNRVNADGTVLIEEYNQQSDHLYHQRTIPASSVPLFLYPPQPIG